MREQFLTRRRGLLLVAVATVATVWLAADGRLDLYISPSSIPFSVVMSVIGLALTAAALLLPDPAHDHAHDHAHDAPLPRPRRERRERRGAVRAWLSGALVAVTALALLGLAPAALSPGLVAQRDLNASIVADEASAIRLAGADPADFDVKDWATLIASGASSELLQSTTATVLGFVVADPESPESAFSLARYVITHCTVDAQPVGVTVRMPGWQQSFGDGDWVQVSGTFVTDAADGGAWVLDAQQATIAEEPMDPYVY